LLIENCGGEYESPAVNTNSPLNQSVASGVREVTALPTKVTVPCPN
jgi:hypothetical protein